MLPHASRALTVSHCINRSHLWAGFTMLELTDNMRVLKHGRNSQLAAFDAWGVSLGDGRVPTVGDPAEELVRLPVELRFPIKENKVQEGLEAFCATIYHDMEEHHMEADFMEGRTILAPTNASVARINSYLMSKLPTEEVVLVSADSTVQPGDAARHPVELLNTLEPQGLPVHQLVLRPGCILRLMRNLNPKDGLCNGSRMRFIKVVDRKVGN